MKPASVSVATVCWFLAIVVLLSFGSRCVVGQSAPRGLYCSCPGTSDVSHSVLPEVAALPFVQGTLLRIGWEFLEPSPGNYDWSILDAEFVRAETYDTDVALAVVLGRHTPSWLETEGAQIVEHDFMGEPGTTVAPWDPILLQYWTEFVAALGERYDGHPRIKLVHVTHSTGNGFEMQLHGSLADWESAGYTHAGYANSWIAVLDAFADGFPSKPLDLDIHPVLGSDDVAAAVVAHGQGALGSQFGVLAAWWTQHNALDVYTGMYTMLLASVCDSFGAVQVARSETVHGPKIFGDGGLAGALELALASNIEYIEVWNSDLINPALQPILAEYAARLAFDLPGDATDDGAVGFDDLVLVLGTWGACETAMPCRGDLDCSGAVGLSDLLRVLANWTTGV